MDEVVVVNENDEIIGTMPKSEAHKNGTLHRIAVVYVENPKGKILVQHRADGYLDHSSAGHVDVGESYEQAGGKKSSHVFDIFKCVGNPGDIQADEVSDVYWAKPEDILLDMQDEENKLKYCGGFLVSLPIYLASRNK